EVFIGVDRAARTDDRIPVASRRVRRRVLARRVRGPGENMWNEDRVVACGIELAVGLVADAEVLDRLAADSRIRRQGEHLFFDRAVIRTGGARRAREDGCE